MGSVPGFGGDPHEGLFVAEIPFGGGGYRTLPSEQAGDEFLLECLLEAAVLRMEDCEFKRWARNVAQFGLLVSDLCVGGAGLTRQTLPGESDSIIWPNGSDARQLEKAVQLDLSFLRTFFEKNGVGLEGMDVLCFEQGDLPDHYSNLLGNPLFERPFLKTEDKLIVVSPTTVVSALRDAILKQAVADGKTKELVGRFHRAIADRVTNYALMFGWTQKAADTIDLDGVVVDEAVYSFDVDKIAVVYTVIDNLENGGLFDGDNHFWDIDSTLDAIKIRAEHQQRLLTSVFPEHYSILHCIVVQGFGRPHSYGFGEIKAPNTFSVICSASELRVISLLNFQNPLELFRAAVSLHELPEGIGFSSFGFLDTYAWYKSRAESYYFGDDGIPDMVMFMGTGIRQRLELVSCLDPHYVVAHDKKTAVSVYRHEAREGWEVFTRLDSGQPELFIEQWPNPVWVRGSKACKDAHSWGTVGELVNAVAFWLWCLTSVATEFSDRPSRSRIIQFFIEADDFINGVHPDYRATGTGISVIVESDTVKVELDANFAANSAEETNRAEMDLVRELVPAIAQLYGCEADAEFVERVVEQHRSGGKKRRMATVSGVIGTMLDTRGLPQHTLVSPFDRQRIDDNVSRKLEVSQAVHDGELPAKQRNDVLNQSVAYMYQQLEELVAIHHGEDLLVDLAAKHEAIIAARHQIKHAAVHELANFGDTPEKREELSIQESQIVQASIANRFLIEYAAARCPKGDRQLSEFNYGRLLALAASIFRTAQISDSIRYGLSRHSITLLGSKRLVIEDNEYKRVVNEFMNRRFARAVEGAGDGELGAEALDTTDLLHVISKAEFGYSFAEIFTFLNELVASSFTQENGLGHCKLDELTAYLGKSGKYSTTEITDLLELLSLTQRADFMKPPKPFLASDVEPWKFNRRLSYLRRPLLIHNGIVTWGIRAIHQAGEYLSQICTSGRLKHVQSQEMKDWQGFIANRLGKQFNSKVAEEVRSNETYDVYEEVKKVNGKKIARHNGEDIGDIDVLAIDGKRKLIFAIEAKCYALSKTAGELGHERDTLFGELNDGTGKIGLHLERTGWLKNHVGDVCEHFKLTASSEWRVIPLLVIDIDLLSVNLFESPIKVLLMAQLVEKLGEWQ